jgi:hypothetical protein
MSSSYRRRAWLLVWALMVFAVLASPAEGRPWRVEPTPNPGTLDNFFFDAVNAAGDLWAVGRKVSGDPGIGGDWRPLIARRTSTGWEQVHGARLPKNTFLAELTGVAAFARDDIWAVGILLRPDVQRGTLVVHWDGTRWTRFSATPFGRHKLVAVTRVPGTHTLWAVGGFGDEVNSAFFDSTAWHNVPVPAHDPPGELTDVAALGPKSVWAVGSSGGGGPSFFEHWDGSSWKAVELPGRFGAFDAPQLTALTTVPGTREIWAVGSFSPGAVVRSDTLIYHYINARWHRVPSPNPTHFNFLAGVTGTQTGDTWAFGHTERRNDPNPHSLVLHHTASGWEVVAVPTEAATGILQTGMFNRRRLWAIGSTNADSSFKSKTLVLSTPR